MANFTKSRDETLTRGQLSKQTGCNIETIRYYEKVALLPEPKRSSGGRRLYGHDDLQRLSFIRRCRELGFSLEQIRSLLALVDRGDFSCAEVRAVTSAHLLEVQEKVRDLRRMERVLKKLIADCVGRTKPECPIIESLSRL